MSQLYTPKSRKYDMVSGLFLKWMAILRLDWEVYLDEKKLDVEATTNSVQAIKTTWIAFNEDFDTWPNERLERLVVHELLHVYFEDMTSYVIGHIMVLIPPPLTTFAEDIFVRILEPLIDRLAAILISLDQKSN